MYCQSLNKNFYENGFLEVWIGRFEIGNSTLRTNVHASTTLELAVNLRSCFCKIPPLNVCPINRTLCLAFLQLFKVIANRLGFYIHILYLLSSSRKFEVNRAIRLVEKRSYFFKCELAKWHMFRRHLL